MAAIETTNLTKTYGELVAVDDLNLTVESGEVFGFLGPNGAGKTTTIDMLLDFIRPTDGRASVLGYDTQDETDEVRANIGILPEGFDLWNRSSGLRHVELAIDTKGGSEDPMALIDMVGLDREDARRNIGEYSKGMKQRLAMAMALAGDPEVLILDEPSSGLDPHGIRQMRGLVRDAAAEGKTVFYSSHILSQVSATCDRVGILKEGDLVTVNTIDGLREEANVGSTLVLTVADDIATDLTDIEGVMDVNREDDKLRVAYADETAKAPVIHRLVDDGVDVLDVTIEESTLEDLFEAYVNGSDNGGEAA